MKKNTTTKIKTEEEYRYKQAFNTYELKKILV